MYCEILFCPANGIPVDPNPAVLPVPTPNALCFKLSSVDDCQIAPSKAAPDGVPSDEQL